MLPPTVPVNTKIAGSKLRICNGQIACLGYSAHCYAHSLKSVPNMGRPLFDDSREASS